MKNSNVFENLTAEETNLIAEYVEQKAEEKLATKTKYTIHHCMRDVLKTVTVTSTAVLTLCCFLVESPE